MGQGNSKPQPGDLIEIDRPRHQHWALYVGDGHVIDLAPVDKQDPKVGVDEVPALTRMVKKHRLKEVAGNDKWRVNNKSDQYHAPLPVDCIIWSAEGCVGKEVTYRECSSNCEHFVTELRYGEAVSEQWRVFVCGEMHFPDMTGTDMTDDKDYPKPGDLIEIKQERYEHWAIYMENGYVIHMTPVDDGAPSMSTNSEITLIRTAKVMKEPLNEVAGDDKWRVNNKYDCHCTALPVEEIIWRAGICIGKEVPYDLLGSNSDDFVRNVRYGGQLRTFVAGEMNIPDMTDDKDYPKPGDLIEVMRLGYEHWALYVGTGYVIHVTPRDENASPGSASSATIFTTTAIVVKELLSKVAGDDKWRVNNKYDCYRAPFPVEKIIQRAEEWIGKEVTYRLFFNNCEHFVTKLRYGKGVSEQAMIALQHIRSLVMSAVGASSLTLAHLPSVTSGHVGVSTGVRLLANTAGFASRSITHSIAFDKFQKARRGTSEERN